jgi:hypothetical protein
MMPSWSACGLHCGICAVPACRPGGMAAVRQYRFQALVTLTPAAGEGLARRLPSRACALTAHACFLVQPTHRHDCFPAVISWDEELSRSPAGRAMMTIALADGEAEALFAPGQRFTIWADGTVGHTIRPEGLVGYCVIACQQSPPPAGVAGDGVQRETVGPDPGYRLAAAGTRAVGQGPARHG